MPIKKPVLAVMFVLAVVPAVILNTPAGYVPLTFLCLASLISVLYTLIAAGACKVTVTPEQWRSYPRESSVPYTVSVVNRSFLVLPHISLTLCAESTQGFPPVTAEYILMLGPREKRELELPLQFPHLGLYDVKISRLRFYGFFGVFSLTVHPRWKERIHVTPRQYDMPGLSIDTSHPVFAVDYSSPCKIDGGEYSDVRQYAPGDPIKNIHWKLSAHASDYVTRVMKTDAVSGLTVYMDLHVTRELGAEETADVNDCTVESACSAALHALKQNYVVEWIYASGGAPNVERPKDYETLYSAACLLPPVSKGKQFPLELLISQHSCRALSLDNIIVLTSTVDERLVEVLSACRQMGKYPILCRVDPGVEDQCAEDGLDRRLAGKGVKYYRIRSARQLAGLLGGLS